MKNPDPLKNLFLRPIYKGFTIASVARRRGAMTMLQKPSWEHPNKKPEAGK